MPRHSAWDCAPDTIRTSGLVSFQIAETVTMQNATTMISTTLVPAYSSIGLTDTEFVVLAVLVIGVLDFIAALAALPSVH